MANLDQIQLNNSGNYSELFISEPPPPYIPGTSASYANNTTVTGNSGTQFHVTEVPSGGQSAVPTEQKITNLNSANQTTTYVVNHVTQPNSYDPNSQSDDLRTAPSLFIDLQGLDEKPASGSSPIKSTPLEIPIQNPVIANLKASGTTYPPPVINTPVANSPPQQSFMNLNQASGSQHNSRTATPINSGTPINTPPTSLTAPLQKANLLAAANNNTSPVQMQPAPITINMEQLQNNLQALGISPAQNGQWTMNANPQLTTLLSALGQQQNVSLANVTGAQLTGQQVNPSLAIAPQSLQLTPQQMVASNPVGLMPSGSSSQVQIANPVPQMQQTAQVQQLQQPVQAQQQVAQVPQVSQVAQVPVMPQQQHVVPQVQSMTHAQAQQIQQAVQNQQHAQAQQLQQAVQNQQHAQQAQQMQQAVQNQQHAQQAQQMQQVAQLQQNGQLTQNQVQQPPNGMAVLQQDGTIMTTAYGASLMNSNAGQMQQFSAVPMNSNQIPQLAMFGSNPVQGVNVAALEHQLQADTLTLMMQMMKTMGELNKRMANLENEVDSLRQQVRTHQQQNMQLQQTLMTVQQQHSINSTQNPNETGQEDKTRANRTNSTTTTTNSNQIMSLNEAPPVNSLGTNPRPGVVNAQYYQTPQSPYYYTTTNNGMAYVQPMASTAVPVPVPVGSQVPGYPGQMYYYTTAQQPTAVQGQQRFVYTNQRQ